MLSKFKKIGTYAFKTSVIVLVTLCLLEIVYRYQWIDFYKGEWKFQKGQLQNENGKKRLLVFGDSFSADPDGWVGYLDSVQSGFSIYNAAIPGVGPETFRLIFENRLKETQPNTVLVQLYVGNDLYDIRKPVNWSTHSISRNLFWSFSNRFRFLNFLNYRLGQAKSDVTMRLDPKISDTFSVDAYSSRTKMYIKGNENYPENMIAITHPMESNFKTLIHFLIEMKTKLSEDCNFKVLVIPHCTQVNSNYIDNFKLLGSKFSTDSLKNKWADRLRNEGFEVIDPLQELIIEQKNGKKVYYDNDPHLNHFGQTIVGEVVSKAINQ